jgi:hypothetical protein
MPGRHLHGHASRGNIAVDFTTEVGAGRRPALDQTFISSPGERHGHNLERLSHIAHKDV